MELDMVERVSYKGSVSFQIAVSCILGDVCGEVLRQGFIGVSAIASQNKFFSM